MDQYIKVNLKMVFFTEKVFGGQKKTILMKASIVRIKNMGKEFIGGAMA